MKLSAILGRILTDVALRQAYPYRGVCSLVATLVDAELDRMQEYSIQVYTELVHDQLSEAMASCAQTPRCSAWPVASPVLDPGAAWFKARRDGTMWRGEYGRNRRKLVRDCRRWLLERGL